MRRIATLIAVFSLLACHSAQLRGPGPANPPAMGHAGNRTAELPPGANTPFNYGWGSAYDPHTPGSRATTGRPTETGSLPPFWSLQNPTRPIGVPPPVGVTPPAGVPPMPEENKP